MNVTVLAGLLAAAIGFGTGYHTATNRCAAKALTAAVAAKEKYDALELRYNTASSQLEGVLAGHREAAAQTTRTITKIVDRPVYRRDCLDAVGLCIANAALAGKSASSCEPAGEVPASPAAR